jgi:hypothetical protein
MLGVRIRGGGVRGIAVAVVLACLLLLAAAPAGASDRGGDSLDRLRAAGGIGPAQYALARARSLFELDRVRSRYGRVWAPAPRAATPILERLAVALPSLSPRARRRAGAMLARPTDGGSDPSADGYRLGATGVRHRCLALKARGKRDRVCVHWATRTADAPPGGRRRVPAQVKDTIRTLRTVWATEVRRMGYRAPLADLGPRRGQGPNSGLDLYLADVGAEGLYGYCIGDPWKQHGQRPKPKRAHAYCVLDNDFDRRQYGSGVSGRPALRVTLAHEFFHAVQSAYEGSRRERWLREGTATWIEDQVFDRVNANYQLLGESPLSQPELPLDAFQASDDGQDFEYGSWTFWQFLSEYYRSPSVVKQVIRSAAPRRGRDRNALGAVRDVVKRRKPDGPGCVLFCARATFPRLFGEFSFWVRNYDALFEEGSGYLAALDGRFPIEDADFVLRDDLRTTGARRLVLAHLTSRQVVVAFNPTLPDPAVRVSVDLPEAAGPSASVEVITADGRTLTGALRLDSAGEGSIEVPEDADAAEVWLILANSSRERDKQAFRYEIEALP